MGGALDQVQINHGVLIYHWELTGGVAAQYIPGAFMYMQDGRGWMTSFLICRGCVEKTLTSN